MVAPTAPTAAAQSACGGDQREVKINDIVGNGISGILYKWVNYGKGWRPRWFVLQDGVLSYYKIHGHDKIVVSQETEKGSRVIGEDSLRRIARNKNGGSQHQRKPVGEVHLKVYHLCLSLYIQIDICNVKIYLHFSVRLIVLLQ